MTEGLFFRALGTGVLSWDMEKERGCTGSPLWLGAGRSEEGTEEERLWGLQ